MNLLRKLVNKGPAVPSDTVPLIRRVIADQGTKHLMAYAMAYTLMAVAAGCTAASAYIVGQAANDIYASGDLWAMVATCLVIIVIFIVRGLASYGQAVLLTTITLTIASEYKIL